jgi:hypothetical protein
VDAAEAEVEASTHTMGRPRRRASPAWGCPRLPRRRGPLRAGIPPRVLLVEQLHQIRKEEDGVEKPRGGINSLRRIG